jgi:alpha-tubulin suppressor-like RCC1 family protein
LVPNQITGNDYKFISNGGGTHCAIRADGTLWGWGNNQFGQTGTGVISAVETVPRQVGTDDDWVKVQVSTPVGIALKANGTVWGWGRANAIPSGIRGSTVAPNQSLYVSPVQLFPGNEWADIHYQGGTFFGIKSDGTLWTFGFNNNGQSGVGSRASVDLETQVGRDSDWVVVTGDRQSSFAIKSDGSLWGWGRNDYDIISPTQATTARILTPTRIGIRNDWVAISAGNRCCYGLTADGFTHVWGYNFNGCFGDGSNQNATKPTQVRQHICWLDVDSKGDNSVALRSDGAVFTAGLGQATGQGINAPATSDVFNQVMLPGKAIAISQGDGFTLALLVDGSIAAFGNNTTGNLANGSTVSQNQPVITNGTGYKRIAAGKEHGLAIRSNGSMWSWGKNTAGVLGIRFGGVGPVTQFVANTPLQVGAMRRWVDVDADGDLALARSVDGAIWAWGDNSLGQIGNGPTGAPSGSPQRIGTNDNWIDVQASAHVMGLQANGTVWVWGDGSQGALGSGTTPAVINAPQQVIGLNGPVVRISTGKALHAILSNGQMRGWAGNGGAVGNGAVQPIQALIANVSNGSEYPYPGGGTHGTQAINRIRSEICYTGLNVNDVAGKPLLNLTDQFICEANVLPANAPSLSETIEGFLRAGKSTKLTRIHGGLRTIWATIRCRLHSTIWQAAYNGRQQ